MFQIDQSQNLVEAGRRCQDWMLGQAFPFWAEHGLDGDKGFFERLDLTGCGISGEHSRVRVQARQTFCFALAAKLGWQPNRALELATFGAGVLVDQCQRSDGLYGKTISLGEGLVDDQAELYDCAFVLLAFATIADVFREDLAYEAGAELLKAIRSQLYRSGLDWGYKERLPAPARREQNPHMHLCEALLAWFEATGEEQSLLLAENVASFVMANFYDKRSGVLLEYNGATDINHCEVGHMYEWVWLLAKIDKLANRSLRMFVFELYEGANALARDQAFLPLKQTRTGGVLDSVQRTWIRTEALKAHCAIHRVSQSLNSAARVCAEVETLFAHHLGPEVPAGAWMDVRDASGAAMVTGITAATGYHIYLAMNEVLSLKNSLE